MRDYLGQENLPLKRVQLAGELGRLFEEYQLSRPDWILQWRQGRFGDRADQGRGALQAACLAKALKETLAAGRYGDPDRKSPELRYEDIFVLAAKKREGRIMARALKAEGIPSALYREEGLFDGVSCSAGWPRKAA